MKMSLAEFNDNNALYLYGYDKEKGQIYGTK